MKIEKINDNQIRCTLTGEDLAERQLRISELAYGTDKAKLLFSDMMRQAAVEFGFEAEHVPLMIEAIPLRSNGIVLIITKVENPEELDTRFSNFSPQVRGKVDAVPVDAAGDYENPFRSLYNALNPFRGAGPGAAHEDGTDLFQQTNHLYSFTNMSDAVRAAKVISSSFTGRSALYEDRPAGSTGTVYYLLLTLPDEDSAAKLKMLLAPLSEYGTNEWLSSSRKSFIENHCRVVCAENAVAVLAQL